MTGTDEFDGNIGTDNGTDSGTDSGSNSRTDEGARDDEK